MDHSIPLPAAAEPLFIGDHLALDFINTRFGVDEGRRECLNSDEDVLEWLRQSGSIAEIGAVPAGKRGRLLKAAIELRDSARELVERRKADSVGDPSVLNRFLALDRRIQQLEWRKGHPPTVEIEQQLTEIEAVLVPVASAVAALLTEADFELVRTCESSDCTLWFYDRTKAHHRRWCSMALCGNRAKVAAFRARQSRN
jgi:predicted RNA-binding Zn ribbon-like protein